MEEFPELKYSQSQPVLYEFTKTHYPDLYKQIKQRVTEGRWEPIGAMWTEADCNIPNGESLVRQILFGKRFLKEEFGKLWDYNREGWARRFFDNWRESLKWQRLKPYEKFAEMIDRHWDGIAAYCKPENKVALGFVEGLNNKIRVIQRRSYGLRDEEYLRLKVLTCMLPAI